MYKKLKNLIKYIKKLKKFKNLSGCGKVNVTLKN